MKPMLAQNAPADFLALKYPLAAEIKYDGVRTIAVVQNKKCTLYSRNGKLLSNYEEIRLSMQSKPEGVYDGEIISPDGFQALMTRTHAEPGKNTNVKIEYKIFDCLTHEEWNQGYSGREYIVRCKEYGERVIIKNPADLEVYYNYVLKSGFEGLILKELTGIYESGKTNYWLKLKPKDTVDLKIVGFEEGFGKYKGSLGAISCMGEYKGCKIYAFVGTGFNDEQRHDIWSKQDSLINKFVEIEFQEVTKPDIYGHRSLRFPVFKCLRLDK